MQQEQLFEIEQKLRDIVGERVFVDIAERVSYGYDGSFGQYLPDFVTQPLATKEVQQIVKLANVYDLPIYPRGAGTNLSGGSLPVNGGIVLDFSQWNDEVTIYPDDLIIKTRPGVKTADIHALAEQHQLMYPPDPSSSSVCTIGGCGAALKEYHLLFEQGTTWRQRAEQFVAKVRDISEIMAQIELKMTHEVAYRAVYQPSCHLENVQKVFEAPENVLKRVPGLALLEMPSQQMCCGSAGIYNLVHYDASMQILDDKMQHVKQARPELIITSNPGCHLQMKLGVEREGLAQRVAVKHIVEVVAKACGIRV